LSAEDVGLLQPHLVPVSLQLRQVLEAPNLPIEHAYFIEHGLAFPSSQLEAKIGAWKSGSLAATA
jgi:hypothetical protein